MTQEALKLALVALQKNTKHLPVHFDDHFEAITAIKEALAQTQEPVVKLKTSNMLLRCHRCGCSDKLNIQIEYATPPQRTWVDLTDEDRKQIKRKANYHWEMTTGEYAERIGELTEAKLKEKNCL